MDTSHPITPILAEIRAAHSEAARLRLLTLRKSLGLTQAQFAEAIGMSKQAIAQIETGNRTAEAARAEAAERLLNAP